MPGSRLSRSGETKRAVEANERTFEAAQSIDDDPREACALMLAAASAAEVVQGIDRAREMFEAAQGAAREAGDPLPPDWLVGSRRARRLRSLEGKSAEEGR